MVLELRSYHGVDGLPFGSSVDDMIRIMGPPSRGPIKDGDGVRYRYNRTFFCFDKDGTLREVEAAYGVPVTLNGNPVEWSEAGLRRLCKQDGNPMHFDHDDTIVLFCLGIAMCGLKGEDTFDWSICAFRRGVWDQRRPEMKPFLLEVQDD